MSRRADTWISGFNLAVELSQGWPRRWLCGMALVDGWSGIPPSQDFPVALDLTPEGLGSRLTVAFVFSALSQQRWHRFSLEVIGNRRT